MDVDQEQRGLECDGACFLCHRLRIRRMLTPEDALFEESKQKEVKNFIVAKVFEKGSGHQSPRAYALWVLRRVIHVARVSSSRSSVLVSFAATWMISFSDAN